MYKFLSVTAGVLVSVMILFNGMLSGKIGNNAATVVIHIVGLLCIIFVLIITKTKLKAGKNIPIYLYSAGAIGVFTVLFTNISFAHLGASITCALSLLGQSICSIIIDHFGLLGANVIKFKKEKLIGLVLISIGIVVMMLY